MCAVLTDVFFQAGELIYVKLNRQMMAKLNYFLTLLFTYSRACFYLPEVKIKQEYSEFNIPIFRREGCLGLKASYLFIQQK